jgi:hypothetical protein
MKNKSLIRWTPLNCKDLSVLVPTDVRTATSTTSSSFTKRWFSIYGNSVFKCGYRYCVKTSVNSDIWQLRRNHCGCRTSIVGQYLDGPINTSSGPTLTAYSNCTLCSIKLSSIVTENYIWATY